MVILCIPLLIEISVFETNTELFHTTFFQWSKVWPYPSPIVNRIKIWKKCVCELPFFEYYVWYVWVIKNIALNYLSSNEGVVGYYYDYYSLIEPSVVSVCMSDLELLYPCRRADKSASNWGLWNSSRSSLLAWT
mgnify:CR=1 FL=1